MPLPFTLDARSPIPLYYQLQLRLRRLIETGELPVGSILPPEDVIAVDLGISRATVRQAIAGLAQDGRLERRRNRGTRVTAPPVHQSLEGFYSFAHAMSELGMAQHSRVVMVQRRPAPADIAAVFGGEQVDAVYVERLRYAGDTPLIVEMGWYAQDVGLCLLAADLASASIYDVLEREGVTISRARETIRPVVLDATQAGLLDAAKGDPAFFVERTSYAQERPVELRRSIIRGDRYLYSVDLPRPLLRPPADDRTDPAHR